MRRTGRQRRAVDPELPGARRGRSHGLRADRGAHPGGWLAGSPVSGRLRAAALVLVLIAGLGAAIAQEGAAPSDSPRAPQLLERVPIPARQPIRPARLAFPTPPDPAASARPPRPIRRRCRPTTATARPATSSGLACSHGSCCRPRSSSSWCCCWSWRRDLLRRDPVPRRPAPARRHRPGKPEETELSLSLREVKVRSPVLGVIILTISLAFFYLYLVHVYPIRNVF